MEDDGRGWPVNGMAGGPGPLSQGTGLGVAGMERRARKLGGQHRFDTSELGGARVWVQVPLGTTSEAPDS